MQIRLVKEEKYKIKAKTRGFKFIFDKPKAFGGNDLGPTAGEMLLASLGTCMISTIEDWANILNIDFEKIKANIGGHLDHRGRLGMDDNVFLGIQNITVDISIISEESKENIQKLIEKVELYCPIHNTLINPIGIKTNFKLNHKKLTFSKK